MTPLDSHTHAFPAHQVRERSLITHEDPVFAEIYSDPSARMSTVEEVQARLLNDGFGGGLMAGFAFDGQGRCEEQNEALLTEGLPSAGAFAVVAAVNLARAGWQACAATALRRGAVGFGELRPHHQGWDPLGPAAARLCEMALDANAVLLWHVTEPVGHKYPGKGGGVTPAELCEVAIRFPELKQIAAHLGGGLPFYLQMPELRKALANVWFDTAATSLLYDDGAVGCVLDLAGSGRVLFGSDYPLLSPRRHLERVLRSVASEYAGGVGGGNLRGMLGGPWK